MKKLLVVLLILFTNLANSETLRWDVATGADGYKAYFSIDGGATYPYNYDAGNQTEILDIQNTLNLQPGQMYTFVVAAYNAVGEGDYSNTVEWLVPSEHVPGVDNLPITISRPATITIIIE